MTPLWETTRDLHHACEQHPVGAAMATGTPPVEWYAGWLMALTQIHGEIDRHLPGEVRRTSRLFDDLYALGAEITSNVAAAEYVATLNTPEKIAGAAYVLTGAHLMGGEIMRRRLQGYPTSHLEWDDRKAALSVLQTYRTREDITQEARDCFTALLAIMDEIQRSK